MKKINIVFGLDQWATIFADNDEETIKIAEDIAKQMETKNKTFRIKDTIYAKSQIKFIEIIEDE